MAKEELAVTTKKAGMNRNSSHPHYLSSSDTIKAMVVVIVPEEMAHLILRIFA